MINYMYLACFMLNYQVIVISSEISRSSALIAKLAVTQKALSTALEDYVNNEEKRLNAIKRYLEICKRETNMSMSDTEKYFGHPVNAFTQIKRLTIDLNYTENLIKAGKAVKTKNIENLKKKFEFPIQLDIVNMAVAFTRIQKTYNLTAREVADGKVKHVAFRAEPLKADDCFVLAEILLSLYDHSLAIAWYKEALQRYKKEKTEYLFTQFDIIRKIEEVYFKIGKIAKAYEWAQKLLALKPESKTIVDRMNLYRKTLEERKPVTVKVKTPNLLDKTLARVNFKGKPRYKCLRRFGDLALMKEYTRLCSKDADITVIKTERLICRYLFENDPFLKIAPIKMEYWHLEPLMVVFHDVLSDNEILALKKISITKFKPVISEYPFDRVTIPTYRVGQSAWLDYRNHDVVRTVLSRAVDMTALDLLYAEQLLVLNYGTGGVYYTHHDIEDKSRIPGYRIATLLFYVSVFSVIMLHNIIKSSFHLMLSDVELGGATVFPVLGVSVRPAKGSALFWMNGHVNGDRNEKTVHGACPVGFGSKWIANLWIRSQQELIIPCTTVQQPDGTYKRVYRFPSKAFTNP